MLIFFFGIRASVAAQDERTPQAGMPGGGYRIAGIVVNKADGHPLARVRVVVRDAKNPQNLQLKLTAEDGKFEFVGLTAGKYSLEGAKRGFVSAGYDQHDQFSTAIVTGAGFKTEGLTLQLAPVAVITGTVLDDVGEPVRHATVIVYYDDHRSGVSLVHEVRRTESDDLGRYEVTPLMPGTYFLSVSARPWYAVHPAWQPDGQANDSGEIDPSLDVAYSTTYYADVTEADNATPIPVRGGDRIQVDVHLSPLPALRLLVHVPESGNNLFPFPQLEQPAFDGSTPVRIDGANMVSPGTMEITGVPAGIYDLRLGQGSAAVQMNAVDLSKDQEEVDGSKGEPLSNVKVFVQLPNDAKLPPRLAVGLLSRHRLLAAWGWVSAKGEADLQQIAAGRYKVLVWGAEKPYAIAQISAQGTEVSGRTITVAAGSSPAILLTVVRGTAEVQGTVIRAGKPVAGAMVVLAPKDPEANRDFFRRDQSDLDGTFSLHGVFPGPYTVLAIENGWDLDWSKAGVIAAYLKHGTAIEVGGHTGPPVSLATPIEVQSK